MIVPPSRPLNPLDVGGLARDRGLAAALEAQAALSSDPTVGVVLIVVATTPQLDAKVRSWGEAALASGTPTAILLTPGALVDSARAGLRARRALASRSQACVRAKTPKRASPPSAKNARLASAAADPHDSQRPYCPILIPAARIAFAARAASVLMNSAKPSGVFVKTSKPIDVSRSLRSGL